MAIPGFIAHLRQRVGHDLLWLPGVTAVIKDGAGAVLLTRRADTGLWALPSGIPEPGEQMAPACAREVLEETGLTITVVRLISVWTQPPITYPNGDICQFVDHAFECRVVSGTAHVADDESLEVAWFPPGDLPELPASRRQLMDCGDDTTQRTWFPL